MKILHCMYSVPAKYTLNITMHYNDILIVLEFTNNINFKVKFRVERRRGG